MTTTRVEATYLAWLDARGWLAAHDAGDAEAARPACAPASRCPTAPPSAPPPTFCASTSAVRGHRSKRVCGASSGARPGPRRLSAPASRTRCPVDRHRSGARPGHHELAHAARRPRRAHRGRRRSRRRPDLSRAGLGRARPARPLAGAARDGARGPGRTSGGGAAGIAAVGIANQRETTVVWERASGAPVAPAIVWQDRRTAATCAARSADAGHEALVRRKHRSRARSLLHGDQAALDPRPRARRAAPRAARRARRRHRRLVARLEPHRRSPARDRRDQRLAHAALRHPPRASGTTSSSSCSACRASCCRPWSTRAPLIGETDAGAVRRRAAHRRAVRRPAGGAVRPRLPRRRPGQAHLRHGLLPAAHTAPTARRLDAPPAHHRRRCSATAARPSPSRAAPSSAAPPSAGCATASAWSLADQASELAAQVGAGEGGVFVPALAGLGAPHWDPAARGAFFGLHAGRHAGAPGQGGARGHRLRGRRPGRRHRGRLRPRAGRAARRRRRFGQRSRCCSSRPTCCGLAVVRAAEPESHRARSGRSGRTGGAASGATTRSPRCTGRGAASCPIRPSTGRGCSGAGSAR